MTDWKPNVSLRPYVTLRTGGAAEWFTVARSPADLVENAQACLRRGLKMTTIGLGSNILPSEDGVEGLVCLNLANQIIVGWSGQVMAQSGCLLQDLFLDTAQCSYTGFEFAVGIPGTLGGALASNAGAYRHSISDFMTRLEICEDGQRRWVEPSKMQFSYRDSILRRPNPPRIVVLECEFQLELGDPKRIYDEAREYQRQRIGKQPAAASAGSFFKNVNDAELASRLDNLPAGLREAGVVPAGYLIEAAGLKGMRHGGAMLGARHANFMLNVGRASASEIFELAAIAKQTVLNKFGVQLEEEVLYLGNWGRWR